MGSVKQHFGGNNATSIALFHYQLRDLWKSPRGTVLRIEALALVAIGLSFILAFFGSCRRWSNRWIVQKGFLAAQVLSLSLGTYSIGLMQSSPMKSEMYPIWAVSLFTLFGCVDPVTTDNGLDYKGPLSKVIFQLCLYCGYVLLMSNSTISSGIGKSAIWVLSAITFVRGFHRSLAFVLPRSTRTEIESWNLTGDKEPAALVRDGEGRLIVHLALYLAGVDTLCADDFSRTDDTQRHMGELGLPEVAAIGLTIEEVCLGYSLSHFLQRHFLGFTTSMEMEGKRDEFQRLVRDRGLSIDYKRTLKVVEVELAFLFEVYFTSNEFLHFYQAKAASLWGFASFIGICFVGVLLAAIPGATASRHSATGPAGAGTTSVADVETTTSDLVITLVILVSLALLQLVQLIRCWTSNWARVAFACEYARSQKERRSPQKISCNDSRWMRLKLFLATKTNWFDKYLWQGKLGQLSVVAARSRKECLWKFFLMRVWGKCPEICRCLSVRFGVHFAIEVLGELLVSGTNVGAAVTLHDDVKASIAEFLDQIKSRRIGVEWTSLFVENGLADLLQDLPYSTTALQTRLVDDRGATITIPMAGLSVDAYAFTYRVMMWHIVTCYCDLAEPQEGSAGGTNRGGGGNHSQTRDGEREKNRRVAMHLSKYCAYLVASSPELLPGPSGETKRAFQDVTMRIEQALQGECNMLEATQFPRGEGVRYDDDAFEKGVCWGKRLLNRNETTMLQPPQGQGQDGDGIEEEGDSNTNTPAHTRPCSSTTDHWEVLARVWVQTLLYAAPYGDAQAHKQRLSQGGEFITHLWALLYHLGIDKWEVAGIDEPKLKAAAGTMIEYRSKEIQIPGAN